MAARRSQRSRKPVSRLVDEQSFDLMQKYLEEKHDSKVLKVDKTFYDAEIKEIDVPNNKVLVHFKGYSTKFDEWKEISDEFPVVKVEQYLPPDSSTVEERSTQTCKIMKKLKADRKDDPLTRIYIDIDKDVFNIHLANIGHRLPRKGESGRKIISNGELDKVLGRNWNVRVKNALGDFGAVIEGTVEYWIIAREPISDFFEVGNKFFPYKIEQCPRLAFTFLRENGNARQYEEKFKN